MCGYAPSNYVFFFKKFLLMLSFQYLFLPNIHQRQATQTLEEAGCNNVNVNVVQDVKSNHFATLLLRKCDQGQAHPLCLGLLKPRRHLRRTFVPVEPSYYQLSSCLPPALRPIVCPVLRLICDRPGALQCDFTPQLCHAAVLAVTTDVGCLSPTPVFQRVNIIFSAREDFSHWVSSSRQRLCRPV